GRGRATVRGRWRGVGRPRLGLRGRRGTWGWGSRRGWRRAFGRAFRGRIGLGGGPCWGRLGRCGPLVLGALWGDGRRPESRGGIWRLGRRRCRGVGPRVAGR